MPYPFNLAKPANKGSYLSAGAKVPDALFTLDKLCEKELLAKAAHESRILTPAFAEQFLPHVAPKFDPLYTIAAGKEEAE